MSGRSRIIRLPQKTFRRIAHSTSAWGHRCEALFLYLHFVCALAAGEGEDGVLELGSNWADMACSLAESQRLEPSAVDGALRLLVAEGLIRNDVRSIFVPGCQDLLCPDPQPGPGSQPPAPAGHGSDRQVQDHVDRCRGLAERERTVAEREALLGERLERIEALERDARTLSQRAHSLLAEYEIYEPQEVS